MGDLLNFKAKSSNLSASEFKISSVALTDEAIPQVLSPSECKKLRMDFGLTRRQAAAAMGVSIDVVENWERGRSRPKPQVEMQSKYRHHSTSASEIPEYQVRNLLFGIYPVRSARHFLNQSVDEIAKTFAVSVSVWKSYETNKRAMKPEMLEELEDRVQSFFASVCSN